ncbi:MAG: sigma-70 family RNA polymerase sigma factor [Candidatus Cloacimonetes bacterium]|nr:sigma-70 family RNA polymerase sigma factor [Candidatus Cloacimonadota bacterium]
MIDTSIDSKIMAIVHSVARRYAKYCDSYDDLVQEGLLGVLEAKSRFQSDKGTQFSTYAMFWIKKRILAYLKLETTFSNSTTELNTDLLADEEIPENEPVEHLSISDFPENMTGEEITILKYMYEKNMTLSDIARKMNQRREKIRQKYKKAMRKLRFYYEEDGTDKIFD